MDSIFLNQQSIIVVYIMGILSKLSGADQNRRDRQDMRDKLESIKDEIEDVRDNQLDKDDIKDLRSRVRELEGVGSKFTDSEWRVLNSLLDSDGFASYSEIAEDIDSSKNNTRAIVNNLKNKIDLDKKTQGRKKLYDVPESVRKEIFSREA